MKSRDNLQDASSANEIAVLALVFLAEDTELNRQVAAGERPVKLWASLR